MNLIQSIDIKMENATKCYHFRSFYKYSINLVTGNIIKIMKNRSVRSRQLKNQSFPQSSQTPNRVITLSFYFTKRITQYLRIEGSIHKTRNFILPEDPFLDVNDIFRPHTMISCVRVDVQTDKIHQDFQSVTKRNNVTFRTILI